MNRRAISGARPSQAAPVSRQEECPDAISAAQPRLESDPGPPDSHHFRGERQELAIRPRRLAYAVWLLVIGGFAVLHALYLSADFPNNTPWIFDWAKYT